MLVSSLLICRYCLCLTLRVTCLCSCKTSWCSSRHCSDVLLIPDVRVFAHVRPLDGHLVIAHKYFLFLKLLCLCSCKTSWCSSRHCSDVLLIPEVACLCSCKTSWCSSRHCSVLLILKLCVFAHVRPLDARLVIARYCLSWSYASLLM
jgi:hypothetical protein